MARALLVLSYVSSRQRAVIAALGLACVLLVCFALG